MVKIRIINEHYIANKLTGINMIQVFTERYFRTDIKAHTLCPEYKGYNCRLKKGLSISSIADKRNFESFSELHCAEIVELWCCCTSLLVMLCVPSNSTKSKDRQSLDCRLIILEENW